jgi:hypothetical protein
MDLLLLTTVLTGGELIKKLFIFLKGIMLITYYQNVL